ncbi:MAG TPA: hypothetical protein VK570_15755, partial [Rubrivivax sp.]|nr:hypothetical protein [Rubrivivax sp.]
PETAGHAVPDAEAAAPSPVQAGAMLPAPDLAAVRLEPPVPASGLRADAVIHSAGVAITQTDTWVYSYNDNGEVVSVRLTALPGIVGQPAGGAITPLNPAIATALPVAELPAPPQPDIKPWPAQSGVLPAVQRVDAMSADLTVAPVSSLASLVLHDGVVGALSLSSSGATATAERLPDLQSLAYSAQLAKAVPMPLTPVPALSVDARALVAEAALPTVVTEAQILGVHGVSPYFLDAKPLS